MGLITSVADVDYRQSESLDAGACKPMRSKYITQWPFLRSTSKGATWGLLGAGNALCIGMLPMGISSCRGVGGHISSSKSNLISFEIHPKALCSHQLTSRSKNTFFHTNLLPVLSPLHLKAPWQPSSHPEADSRRQTCWLWDLCGGVLPFTCGLTVASEVTGEAMQDGLDNPVVEANDQW